MFSRSFQIAAIIGIMATVGVAMTGHSQAQHMVETQPMKMAAAEALWESEDPAAMSLFTIGNEKERRDVFAIRIPAPLSLLSYNQLTGEVRGINDLQAEYEANLRPRQLCAAGRHQLLELPHHGRRGHCSCSSPLAMPCCWRWAKKMENKPRFMQAVHLAHPPALPGHRDRLDFDRSGPRALDCVWPDEDRGCDLAQCVAGMVLA